MKRWIALLLTAVLLAGCNGAKPPAVTEPTETEELVTEEAQVALLGGSDGVFHSGDVLVMSTGGALAVLSAEQLGDIEVEAGDILRITHIGIFLESYPMQFGSVKKVEKVAGAADKVGLVLQIFEELRETGKGLTEDAKTIGVDLSGAEMLSAIERQAVIWALQRNTGLEIVEGTFEELAEQGYIDADKLEWIGKGALFEFSGKSIDDTTVQYDARIWRSGTGAVFSEGVNATWKDGNWTMKGGSHGES